VYIPDDGVWDGVRGGFCGEDGECDVFEEGNLENEDWL
jgi:hypothetical protein